MGKIKDYWNEQEQQKKQERENAPASRQGQSIRDAFADYKGAPTTYQPSAVPSSIPNNSVRARQMKADFADAQTARKNALRGSSYATSPRAQALKAQEEARRAALEQMSQPVVERMKNPFGTSYIDSHTRTRSPESVSTELTATQDRLRALAEEMAAAEENEDSANSLYNQYNASPASGAYRQSDLYKEREKGLWNAQNASRNAQNRYGAAQVQERALQQEYYNSIPRAADYAEKKVYTGAGSELYRAVNGDEAAQQDLISRGIEYSRDYSWVRNVGDDVRGKYNYIYTTQGEEAAEKFLNASVEQPLTGAEALAYGAMQGTGLPSLAAAAGSAVGRGDEARSMLEWAARGAAQSQRERPVLYGTGNTVGSLALMTAIGEGLGAIGAFNSFGDLARGALRSAATFGTTSAIQGAGSAATGETSAEDYAANVLTSAARGAAGGALSGYETQELMNGLRAIGLANNTLARAIAAGFSGMAYSAGSLGAETASGIIREGNGYTFDADSSLKDMLIAGAFGTIRYLLDAATGTNYTVRDESESEAQRLADKYFGGMSADEVKAEYRRLAKMYHPDRAQFNGIDAEEAARVIREVNAAYEWIINSSVTTAARTTEARTAQSAEAAQATEEAISLISGAIEDGIISGAEIAEAVDILRTTVSAAPQTNTASGTETVINDNPAVHTAVQKNSGNINQELNMEQNSPQLTPETPLDPIASAAEDTPSEKQITKSGNSYIPGEKNGLPFDVVIERIPAEDTAQKLKANNDEIVETVKETMGAAGKMTLGQIYEANTDVQTGDASKWAMAAKEVYEAGKELPDLPYSPDAGLGRGVLDETTAQMIYNAGQVDARASQAELSTGETGGSTPAVENAAGGKITAPDGTRDEVKRIRAKLNAVGTAEEDGRQYSISENGDGSWRATIQKVSRAGGVPVLDGRKLYDGRYATREEAAEELAGVAENVFYPRKAEKDLQGIAETGKLEASESSLKAPDYSGWDAIVNEDAIASMSSAEKEAVNRIFSGKSNKEDLNNVAVVGEVSDGERVLEPAVHGPGDGGVLDRVAPEGVRADETGGNAGGVLRPEGRGVRGHAGRPDTAGDERGHGVGSREERGDLPDAGAGRGRTRKAGENSAAIEGTPAHDGAGGEEHTPVLAGRPVDRGRSPVSDRGGRSEAVTEEAPQTVSEATEHEIEVKREEALREEPRGVNFVIPQSGLKLPSGEKARFKANVQAIKTLRTLMAEGRFATPAEQETLSKYVGWGGLANAFDERKEDWAKEFKQLKSLLSDSEYKAARGSTLNAHYTDVGVIRGIYAGLEKLGFTGGRLLEPSAGVGHFAGAMPENLLPGVKSWTMVELDEITGNIAKYLYPNADVRVQGFETAKIPDNYMDMAISNVPFGNYGIVDKTYPKAVTSAIHNYFFAKALDKVRPGGLVTFITSRYTMDAQDDAVRRYIMQRADLLGAVRLPETAFQSNAGTSVVTDIIVLKKRAEGTKYAGEEFLSTGYHHRELGIWEQTNDYYTKHPEMVLGEASKTGSMYRANALTYTPKDTKTSLQKQIEQAFGRIKGKMDYPVQRTQEQIRQEIKKGAANGKNGSIVKRNGKLYQNKNGELVEADVSEKDTARMESIIGIRDLGRELLNAQLDNKGDKEIALVREALNRAYDDFVAKYGPLHKSSNPSNIKLVRKDADSPFILALENYDKDTKVTTKAAIFTKNTVTPNVTVSHVDTVEEGLIVVMNELGTVDVARIAELTGENPETVRKKLLETELAYLNRDGNLETAEQYLSGNVKAKLRDAEALAEGNDEYKRNVEALRKIIPADIPPEEISVRPGATWIPAATYADFAAEILGGSNRGYRRDVEVSYNKFTGEYTVKLTNAWMKSRPENLSVWGTADRSFINIFTATLNNKSVTVWRTTEDGKRFIDKTATAAAQEKQEKMLAEFQKWMWRDEKRKTELAKLYNDIFNNTVTPKYDGSNLVVNGSNPDKPMRPHQKDFVQRAISSGCSTLNAYCVGAGKTYALAATAMKMRQLGIAKKPLIIVPKALVSQWGKEFYDYFPAANIRVVGQDEFTAAKRKQFVNSVATGDYDAIIMSQQQFKAIPMSLSSQEAFYQEQVDELEMAILDAAAKNGKRDPTIKQLERSKKSLETKLKKLGDMKKDEDNIDFESLGVDALFVDEAHAYKNLFYTTKMQRVSGLGNTEGNQQTTDLYMKTRYLQKLNGGRGVVFATATPVMNSMSEMYIMQKYLQSDMLEAKGLTSFDAWANQFGEVRTVLEMNPSGKGYSPKQSFSRFKNVPELQQMFRSFADVMNVSDLTERVPNIKIPTMKTGKRIIVESEPSEFQLNYIDQLNERAKATKSGNADLHKDNMLKITGEGRKVAYTQRMIDPSLPYEEGNKIAKCAKNVYDIWKESEAQKGTQIIFCDLSTPKGGAPSTSEEGVQTEEEITNEDISIYEDIRNMLIGQGIPAKDIAFIHDADDDDKKVKLFDDMNEGRVRILIGSTGKMGVGMNAQKRVVALHHLDAPWRPGDIEQREGRALRQGNMNDEVGIYVYVTKRTFDSRMWDNLQRKASFIHQVMKGDLTARECEGDGDFALSAAEIAAISSGNPLIMEQFEVAAELANLESLERAHNVEVADALAKSKKARAQLISDTEQAEKLRKDLAARRDTSGDKFSISIGGKAITERKAAGEAIIAQAKKYLNISREREETKSIGKFAGFELLITNGGDVLLRGAAQYRTVVNMQSAMGTVQSLEALPRKIDALLTDTESRIAENTSAIGKLDKLASEPFGRADELARARKRNAEIMAELNPDESSNAAALDEDDTDNLYVDVQAESAPVKQEVSSAKTSIKQVPALFKDKNVVFGDVNIDIGGGRFDLATEYLKERGTLNLVFDPYNRGEEQNSDTLDFLRGGHRADTATCANVLNVIAEPNARANVILEMAKSIKPDGKAYFMVYEGDGSGTGRETSAGWQNNRKTADYMDEIRRYFRSVRRQGKLIIAEQPNENLPKASWEVVPGKAIQYSRSTGTVSHPEEWTAKRAPGVAEKAKPVSELMEQIRHDFGINITKGHIRGKGVRGQYNKKNNGIRIKEANQLTVAAHELGHALDAKYAILERMPAGMKAELTGNLSAEMKAAYKEEDWPGEGLAEFVREYLRDHSEAEYKYPQFTGYFLNSLDKFDSMRFTQLADDMNAYFALDGDTAVSAVRLMEEPLPDYRTRGEKTSDRMEWFRLRWIDANEGIRKFERETGARGIYTLASNAAYADSRAAQLLCGDLRDIHGQYVGPGLNSALATIDLANKEEYRLFGEYLIVKHGPERLAEGMRIFADDRKNNKAFMDMRSAQLERQYPGFKVAAERLYEFQESFLQTWLVDTGLVSQESAEAWAERWKYYVPLNRAVGEGKYGNPKRFANQRSPIHRAYGSGLDIIDPVDNIIRNVVTTVNVAVRNDVFAKLTDAADSYMAEAWLLEKVPMPVSQKKFDMAGIKASLSNAVSESTLSAGDKDVMEEIIRQLEDVLTQYGRGRASGNVLTVLKNGNPEYWKVNDPVLLESLTQMSPKELDGLLGAYASISRFLTGNITGRNVLWSIFSNAPRDFGTLLTYSRDKNVVRLVKNIGSSYVNAVKSDDADPLYKEYLAMGGGSMSAYSADKDLAKKIRNRLERSRKLNKVGWNPIDWLDFTSDLIETGPRFATYKILRTKYGLSPEEAFYEASDITVNFRRGGKYAREINKIVPFFNAGVQGMDKARRYFTAEDAPASDRKKAIRNRWAIFLASSALMAAAMHLLNNKTPEDEENYEQLSSYVKNNYFAVPLGGGKYFTVPKPRELGVATSFMQAVMQFALKGDEHAFDEFGEYAAGVILPNIVADVIDSVGNGDFRFLGDFGILGVAYYLGANKDFLGRDIVSYAYQQLEPKDQYNATTSRIAYLVGQAFGLSPMKIDFAGNNILGGWWKVQRSLFPLGEENVDYTLGIQGNYVKDNLYSTDIVNRLYEQAEKSSRAKNSNEGNIPLAITAKQDGNMKNFYSTYYKLAKELPETDENRATRQQVIDMIKEYLRYEDHGFRTETQNAVYQLCERYGDVSVLPSVMDATVKDGNGKSYSLTAEQYVEFQTDYLRIYWNTIERVLAMRDAKGEEARWEVIRATKQYASEEAKARALKRIGAGTTSYGEKHEGINLEDWVMYKALVKLIDDNGSISQDEAEETLWQMMMNDGLTEEEAARIFSAQGSKWKNNPFS